MIKVHLLIRYLKGLSSNIKYDYYVISLDIIPGILDLLEIDLENQTQGVSLLPYIFNEADSAKEIVCYGGEDLEGCVSTFIASNHYKLISNDKRRLKWPFSKGKFELYNIQKDKNENETLIKEHPKNFENLQNNLNNWLNYCRRTREQFTGSKVTRQIVIAKKMIEKLNALGYVK